MAAGERRNTTAIVGVVLMVASFFAAAMLIATFQTDFFRAINDAFLSKPLTAPIDTTVSLYPGEWAVYVQDGSAGGPTGGTGVQAAQLTGVSLISSAARPDNLGVNEVAITAPDGHQLVLRDGTTNSQERITRGPNSYLAELKFDVQSGGAYHFVVAGNDGTLMFLAPTFSGVAGLIPFGHIVGIGFSALAFLVGLIVLIVGLVRHSQNRPAAVPLAAYQVPVPQPVSVPQPVPMATVLPPAGWYPDPMRTATWRYWDGQAWTAHTG